MIGWLGFAYPWVKAAHVVFVIYWMAGLFMLPRFLVYHHESAAGSPEDALWRVREARLVSIILKPASIAVWGLGLALVVNIGAGVETWLRLKVVAVAGLLVYQFWLTALVGQFACGERRIANRTLRLANELPSLAAIVIVVLVIVKPF